MIGSLAQKQCPLHSTRSGLGEGRGCGAASRFPSVQCQSAVANKKGFRRRLKGTSPPPIAREATTCDYCGVEVLLSKNLQASHRTPCSFCRPGHTHCTLARSVYHAWNERVRAPRNRLCPETPRNVHHMYNNTIHKY